MRHQSALLPGRLPSDLRRPQPSLPGVLPVGVRGAARGPPLAGRPVRGRLRRADGRGGRRLRGRRGRHAGAVQRAGRHQGGAGGAPSAQAGTFTVARCSRRYVHSRQVLKAVRSRPTGARGGTFSRQALKAVRSQSPGAQGGTFTVARCSRRHVHSRQVLRAVRSQPPGARGGAGYVYSRWVLKAVLHGVGCPYQKVNVNSIKYSGGHWTVHRPSLSQQSYRAQ